MYFLLISIHRYSTDTVCVCRILYGHPLLPIPVLVLYSCFHPYCTTLPASYSYRSSRSRFSRTVGTYIAPQSSYFYLLHSLLQAFPTLCNFRTPVYSINLLLPTTEVVPTISA